MKTGIEQRKVEIGTAAFFVLVGCVVIYDSFRTGFQWTSDGPAPGYFPFYIGLFMVVAAVYQIAKTIKNWSAQANDEFASHEQIGLVLRMFVPVIVYVAGVMTLGLYVSSIIYISAFMIWQGKFSVVKSLLVAFGVSAVLFLLFEIWFHVPLPKGPLEALFGF